MKNELTTICKRLEDVFSALNLLTVSGWQNCNIVAGCGNSIRDCMVDLNGIINRLNEQKTETPEPEALPAEAAK